MQWKKLFCNPTSATCFSNESICTFTGTIVYLAASDILAADNITCGFYMNFSNTIYLIHSFACRLRIRQRSLTDFAIHSVVTVSTHAFIAFRIVLTEAIVLARLTEAVYFWKQITKSYNRVRIVIVVWESVLLYGNITHSSWYRISDNCSGRNFSAILTEPHVSAMKPFAHLQVP